MSLQSITEKPASARLWAGQDTEKDIGLPYDSLDLIVYTHLQGWTPAKIATETGVDAAKCREDHGQDRRQRTQAPPSGNLKTKLTPYVNT